MCCVGGWAKPFYCAAGVRLVGGIICSLSLNPAGARTYDPTMSCIFPFYFNKFGLVNDFTTDIIVSVISGLIVSALSVAFPALVTLLKKFILYPLTGTFLDSPVLKKTFS